MAEKYNETMNRVELSAEARERILGNIRKMELSEPKRGKVIAFPQWKRWAALAACAAVVLLAAVTLNPREPATPDGPLDQQGTVQIANPIVDHESLEDAARAVGFTLDAPESVEGYDDKDIQVVGGSMIQLVFRDSSENRLYIRKEAGSGDVSGDCNSYTEVKTVAVDGRSVTLKGDAGAVSTAVWRSGGYSYAVMSDVPMGADAMTALVAQIA